MTCQYDYRYSRMLFAKLLGNTFCKPTTVYRCVCTNARP